MARTRDCEVRYAFLVGVVALLVAACAAGDPHVRSGFGSPWGVKGGDRSGAHAGVDFAAERGSPVLAAADGIVIASIAEAGWPRVVRRHGCGLAVLVGHVLRQLEYDPTRLPRDEWKRWLREEGPFEYYTVYCHMETIDVVPGVVVKRGQILGKVGTTGNSEGIPHVHLQLCRFPCAVGSPDGELKGLLDPLEYDQGCYEAGRVYASKPLVLTHPIVCAGR